MGYFTLEPQPDPQLETARLQDVQQPVAPDTAEAVAGGTYRAAAKVNLDVVPVVEGIQDLGGSLHVGRSERRQRLVGEHYTPAECVRGAIALDDGHLVRRIALLHQQGDIEASRAPADAGDAHKPDYFRP